MPQLERREALPVHPVPAGLAAPDAWRLRVDGLVTQRLALSISAVEALGAQARTADFICEEGWMVPDQQWEGVTVAAILGRAGVKPEARFLKVYAGNFTVLLPLEEGAPLSWRPSADAVAGGADGWGITGALSQRCAAHAGTRRAVAAGGARSGVLLQCEMGGSAGSAGR
jgi:hypothetical protein